MKLRVPVESGVVGVSLRRRIVIGSLHSFVKCGGGNRIGKSVEVG